MATCLFRAQLPYSPRCTNGPLHPPPPPSSPPPTNKTHNNMIEPHFVQKRFEDLQMPNCKTCRTPHSIWNIRKEMPTTTTTTTAVQQRQKQQQHNKINTTIRKQTISSEKSFRISKPLAACWLVFFYTLCTAVYTAVAAFKDVNGYGFCSAYTICHASNFMQIMAVKVIKDNRESVASK